MAEYFYGSWEVKVLAKDADFSQRFIVEGSDSSDGEYLGDVSTPPVVGTGKQWSLRFEWNDNAASGWQPSEVHRTSATFTLDEGLLVYLGVDDNLPQVRDGDFNDVVVRCRSLDPALNPWIPFVNPYEFTIAGKQPIDPPKEGSTAKRPVRRKRHR